MKTRTMIPRTMLAVVIAALIGSGLEARAQPAEQLIRSSTTVTKARVHILFREIVTSQNQSDWSKVYNAAVEVNIPGADGKATTRTFRGSTLPNFEPGTGKPADWQYSVVLANCAFPAGLRNRYYQWDYSTRANTGAPCLRLAQKVPTVNAGSERKKEAILLHLEEEDLQNLQFAQNILVHSGSTANWRGSAGCLTIHPDDADAFFALLKHQSSGTLEIDRGIEDPVTRQSACY